MLQQVFDATAPHYDWITGVMSFGTGAWYRRDALQRAGLREGMQVLDVAVGTGAVARPAAHLVGPSGRVVGLDPSMGMLVQARRTPRLRLVRGVAEQLPFRHGEFDFLSMAYALRHVVDLSVTLAEYLRVLKAGGTLLLLDFCRPGSWLGRHTAHVFLDVLVPWAARLRAGQREAELLTHYCWDTIDQSVPPATILAVLDRAGFALTSARRLGVLAEYIAVKPARDGRVTGHAEGP